MKRKTTNLSATTVFATFICVSMPTVNAQSGAETLPAQILACAEEKDVIKRLSCYDREVAALRAVPETAPVPVAESAPSAPAGDTAAPPTAIPVAVPPTGSLSSATMVKVAKDTEADDGASAREAPSAQSDEVENFGLNRPVDDISANVVEIRERPYGEMIIRLDNGQVWEQKHLDRRFRLRIGETVTITRGAVSGYRLSGSNNNSIQVKRLK